MKTVFGNALRQATRLTRAQNVMEATRLIQRALSGRDPILSEDERPPKSARRIERQNDAAEGGFEQPRPDAGMARASSPDVSAEPRSTARMKGPLGEVLKRLREADLPSFDPASAPYVKLRKAPTVLVPDGATYLTKTFACEAGSRDYTIYVPSRKGRRKRPLIIMLHGCTQNPDDFAVGTGMNRLAEELDFIVAYPGQAVSANPTVCWNWFQAAHQMRDQGEPSLIAGMTRAIMAAFDIDSERVYVAGLSAGGAMAAVMSATYPELYAATGIHSGLAYGSATDMASAFAAMKGTPGLAQRKGHAQRANGRARTIVFHGVSDPTVHPSNAEAILAGARAGLTGPGKETIQAGSTGGRAYARTVITDARGIPQVEYWAIEGLGHAWSGGSPEGSYTDPHGPDASREMLRFFLASQARPQAT